MARRAPKGGWLIPDAVATSKVFNTNIDGMFRGRGIAAEYCREVLADAEAMAQTTLNAHKRTGELREGLHNSGSFMWGRAACRGFLYNTAPYALFVENGVKGVISPRGPFMLVPKHEKALPLRQGGKNLMRVGPIYRKQYVRGQVGLHYLRDSMNKAVRGRKGWIPTR